MSKKKEKKAEYRISVELNYNWGIAYYVEKRDYFLGIGYWRKLNKYGLSGKYTVFRYKRDAEELIEEYKNGKIKELEDNVVGYY